MVMVHCYFPARALSFVVRTQLVSFTLRTRGLLLEVSGKMRSLTSATGTATHDAWNSCSVQLVDVARVSKTQREGLNMLHGLFTVCFEFDWFR